MENIGSLLLSSLLPCRGLSPFCLCDQSVYKSRLMSSKFATAKGPSSILQPIQGFQFWVGGHQETTPDIPQFLSRDIASSSAMVLDARSERLSPSCKAVSVVTTDNPNSSRQCSIRV